MTFDVKKHPDGVTYMKDYLKIAENCPCSKKHTLSTRIIVSEENATEKMIAYVSSYVSDTSSVLIVCDKNTEKYALPVRASLGCGVYTFPENAHANEVYTAMLTEYINSSDVRPLLFIACGSGSIHDITRFCAYEAGIEFISYPTAASVDGFVSGVAAMTMYGQKLTYPSASPTALFADPDVYSDAPARLTASGVGDVIGKITALYDWKAAHLLSGETLCPEIYELMKEALDTVINAAKSKESTRIFAEKVMNGLILSGIAMQLQGNSRPASGSEHHMSHFWEMHVINRETDALHGEKVGVGTILALRLVKNNIHRLESARDIDLGAVFDRDMINAVYGNLTDGIIKENLPSGGVSSSVLAELGNCTADVFDEIKKNTADLPSPGEIRDLLISCGAPVTLTDLSLPDEDDFIERSVMFSPYVRNRLTVAKILSAVKITKSKKNEEK